VSTVKLPMDHGFKGTPIWYETLVFTKGGDQEDMQRYTTQAEAEEGHRATVERWNDK
jgi:hypothetical protein